MNKKSNFGAVGISSLLVIFAVLCLTVFAILTVSTQDAQFRLAKASRSAISEYYKADSKAEKILCEIRNGEVPQNVKKDGNVYSYICPISKTQNLSVAVRVEGKNYTVLKWQAVSTAEWQTDNKLPVWNGSQP